MLDETVPDPSSDRVVPITEMPTSALPDDAVRRDADLADARDTAAARRESERATPAEPVRGRSVDLRSGVVVADRYRLLTRLGEGGMGEVWRARDDELDEDVAIKFLAPALAANRAAITQLRREVQLSRRVTHPNVCRVHDIGQAGDRPFLTMEYVDGESLKATLERVGKFPPGRVREIALQICDGLQAAHDLRILHRDLKPANVMLDSAGRVRITDFGIAHAFVHDGERTGGTTRRDLRPSPDDDTTPGSPAYMAPELFTGTPASVQSDLYALGLVLWELHTGRQYFRASTMTELLRQHRRPQIPIGDEIPDVDRPMEQAVQRCLAREPEERPRSVRAVRAILEGGDALTVALASGETPSVDEVAQAGGAGRLDRTATVALLVALLAAMYLVMHGLGPRTSLVGAVELPKSGEVLANRARELVAGPDAAGSIPDLQLARGVGGPHEAWGFDVFDGLLEAIAVRDESPQRWQRVDDDRLGAIDFWFRQSPVPLVAATSPRHVVSFDLPAHNEPGMVGIRLDRLGRMRELVVIPRELLATSPAPARDAPPPEPDWQGAFTAAGLGDVAAFEPVRPQRVPTMFADLRRAWLGIYPEDRGRGGPAIRVEGAALGGRLVAFRVLDVEWRDQMVFEPPSSVSAALLEQTRNRQIGTLLLTIAGIVLAIRALGRRRVDVRGALRFGASALVVTTVATLLVGNAALEDALFAELASLRNAVLRGLGWGAQLTIFYLAVEGLLRRVWPTTLIGWTRLLRGRVRDPLVGRDILVGLVVGAVAACLFLGELALRRPTPVPFVSPLFGLEPLTGLRQGTGCALEAFIHAARFSVAYLVVLATVQLAVRERAVAIAAYAIFLFVFEISDDGFTWTSVVFGIGQVALATFVVIRFGALALGVSAVAFLLLAHMPHPSVDPDDWHAYPSYLTSGGILTLAAYATWLLWRRRG